MQRKNSALEQQTCPVHVTNDLSSCSRFIKDNDPMQLDHGEAIIHILKTYAYL
jgi:hypothetical protein